MALAVSTRPSMRRVLPWFGIGALVVAALTVLVVSPLVPDDATWWATGLVAASVLAASFVLEHLAGRGLEKHARGQQVAEAVEGLRARAPQGLATLLSPHRASEIELPLLGRETEMADLVDWCTSSATRFRLITGPGGIGKTRLADELQSRLRDSAQQWETLFLGADRSAEPGAVATLREHAGDRPVLIVVDYAENRPNLREFLDNAFEDTGTIRVLMLARQAGNWWDKLTNIPGGLGNDLQSGYRGKDLPDVQTAPQVVLDHATAAFAAHLRVPAPRVRIKGADQLRILDLTAIALVAVLDVLKDPGHVATATRISIGEVFTELLRHEADRYWRATAREVGLDDELTDAMQRVLVAAVALLGAPDEPSTLALAGRVLGTFTDEAIPDAAAAGRWLRKTYPATDEAGSWVASLTPDRVAEHLVVETLTIRPSPVTRRVKALLEDLSDDQAVQAMTVLSRAATDPARSHDQDGEIRVLADHVGNHLPPHHATVARVLAVIPRPSVTMSSTAVALARAQLDLLENSPELDEERLANAARELGFWFSRLGRPDEALRPTQRAVDLYRQLARTDPEGYEPDLATTLGNLGAYWSLLGRPDEALRVTQEAVGLYERLARADDRHAPELAAAANNLGAHFADMGRLDDALLATLRAVELLEPLVQTDDRYAPELAGAAHNLGFLFAWLGHPVEAVTVVEGAVYIYEQLARIDPDRYEPDLAMSLSSLGLRFSELGRPEEALLATQRAVNLCERLTRTNPGPYEPGLASALSNLGRWFAEAGRPVDALQATQRAVELYEQLARTNPGRYNLDLAGALNDLGCWLSQLGRLNEALSAARRAVSLYEELSRTNPDRYEPSLALSLHNLGLWLSELGRPDEALTSVERAISLNEGAARRDSAWYRADDHQDLRDLMGRLRRSIEQTG